MFAVVSTAAATNNISGLKTGLIMPVDVGAMGRFGQ
jgi:hypothetical protein